MTEFLLVLYLNYFSNDDYKYVKVEEVYILKTYDNLPECNLRLREIYLSGDPILDNLKEVACMTKGEFDASDFISAYRQEGKPRQEI